MTATTPLGMGVMHEFTWLRPTAAGAQYTGGAPATRPEALAERMATAGSTPFHTGEQSTPGLQAATQTPVQSVSVNVINARQLYDPETQQQLFTRGGFFEEWVLELGTKSRNELCARVKLGKGEKAELLEAARRLKHLNAQKRYATKMKNAKIG